MTKFSKLKAYLTNKEILKRLAVTLVLLFVFRLFSKIPAPGIEPEALKKLFGDNPGGLFNIANILAGGTLTQFSIISVGLIAFVNASIILQLLGTIVPKIEQIQKMGETGQKIINQWTRILTVPLACIQSVGVYLILKSQSLIDVMPMYRIVSLVFVLTAGAMLLMWIAEILSERGLGGKQGGGISVIVTAGILAALPNSIAKALNSITTSEFLRNVWVSFGIEILLFVGLLAFGALIVYLGKLLMRPKNKYTRWAGMFIYAIILAIIPIAIFLVFNLNTTLTNKISTPITTQFAKLNEVKYRFGFYLGITLELIGLITFFNESFRKIPVKFIHRIRTSNATVTQESSSYLPVKLLAPGVIPIIFATSMLFLPQVIYNFFGPYIEAHFVNFGTFLRYAATSWLNQQTSIYFHILQFILVVLFSFFYIFVIMKPENIADDLKRSQSFIPNVRPGKETVNYISGVIARVTFWGGITLAILSSLPFILGVYQSSVSSGMEAFIGGGTAILIVVSSLLAIKIQLDAMVLTKNYEQFEEI
jgi:preprotein translocase subunit SecY